LAGEIVHIEIPADDTGKSQEFWGPLFGWQFQANPGPFEYHTTQISGEQGAAITNMEPGKRGMRPYFAVDDIKAGSARVKELGGEANEPLPVPAMGWFSTCKDPQGNDHQGAGIADPNARLRVRGRSARVNFRSNGRAMVL